MKNSKTGTVLCTLLLLSLASTLIPVVLGYSNSPLWSKNLVTYTPQKYRISLTNDQNMVVTNNGSFVVGLGTSDGQTLLSYLPARNGDVIDGIVTHPTGKYIASIVNGTFINVFNTTNSRGSIFKSNSSVKNILLPQPYPSGEYTIFYSTADFNITRVNIKVPGKASVAWKIHLGSDVNVLDTDDSSYRILAGLNNGTLLVINPLTGGVIVKKDFGAQITSLKISSFGFFVALTTSDGMLYYVRTDNLYVLQSFSFGTAKGVSTSISFDGGKIVVGLNNGTIFYYRYLTGETKKIAISSSPISIVTDKNLDYISWASGRQVGLGKFAENPLWSSTVSDTSTDIAVTLAKESPSYVVACSKVKIFLFNRKPFAQMTLSANPQTVGVGRNVTLSGQLTPILSNQTIRFYAQSNSTDAWKLLGNNITDSTGRYKFMWRANITGSPNIKAVWSGNDDFRETSAIVSLDVRKSITVTVRTITLSGKPIQNIKLTVNGTKYYTNQTGYIMATTYAGTVSIIAESSSQFSPESRYQFKMWELGDTTKNQLTAKLSSNSLLIAKYSTAYRVNFTLPNYFLVDASPAGDDGWFENGTSVEVLALPLSDYNTSSSRIIFVGWEGTGLGSYSGSARKATIKVLGPIKENILWKRQFKLNLLTTPSIIGKAEITIKPSSEDYWFDEKSRLILEAPGTVPYGSNRRYTFSFWKSDTTMYTNRTLNVVMDGAKTVNASFYIQYLLDITSDAGKPIGTGWYNSSEKVTFGVSETIVTTGVGVRKKFMGWVGNFTSTVAINEIEVKGPMNMHANYITQYYLNVTSPYSNVVLENSLENPSDWYSEGSQVTFSMADLRVEKDFFSYYYFNGWYGDLDSSEPTVVVNLVRPMKVQAIWKEDLIYLNILLVVIPIIIALSLVLWIILKKRLKRPTNVFPEASEAEEDII